MIDEGMASGQVAARYDEHAVLESEVAERLLEPRSSDWTFHQPCWGACENAPESCARS